MLYDSGENFQRILTTLKDEEELFEHRASASVEKEIHFALMLAFVAVLREDYQEGWIQLLQTLAQDQHKKKLDINEAFLFLQRVQLTDAKTDSFVNAYRFLAGDGNAWLFRNNGENLLKIEYAARYILQNPHKFEYLKEGSSVGSSRQALESDLYLYIKKQMQQDIASPKNPPKLLEDKPLFSASLRVAALRENSLQAGLREILPVDLRELLNPTLFMQSIQLKEAVALEEAMLLALMFECANAEERKQADILRLIDTYGAYLFEAVDLKARQKVTKFLEKKNKEVIQERMQSILSNPEQYHDLFSSLYLPRFNRQEFVAHFNQIKGRMGPEAIIRNLDALVGTADDKEIKVFHVRKKGKSKPPSAPSTPEQAVFRTPSTPRKVISKAHRPPRGSTSRRRLDQLDSNGTGFNEGEILPLVPPLPVSSLPKEEVGALDMLLPGQPFELDTPRQRALTPLADCFRAESESESPARTGRRSANFDQSSPGGFSSSVDSADALTSLIDHGQEEISQAPDNRKELKQALDDYAAHLQILLLMMEFNLETLDSPSARDRLALHIDTPYAHVLPSGYSLTLKDEEREPIKSVSSMWEAFTTKQTDADFRAKVQGTDKDEDKVGFYYYLGRVIRAGKDADLGKRAKAMRDYRKVALNEAKMKLQEKYSALSKELECLYEGHALESVSLTHRFTTQLVEAVHADEISLHKHDNRRLEQIKRTMIQPITHFQRWAKLPANAPTDALTTSSQEFTQDFKQEMFNVEDEIRRDWGRKSDLRRIVREFVDQDKQFDLMANRIEAVKAFINRAAIVPNELFVEHNYCLLNQALREALLSGKFPYNDSRVERYLNHLNDNLPATTTSKHFIQEIICQQISAALDLFKDQTPLFKRHDLAELAPFLKGDVVIAGEPYPVVKGKVIVIAGATYSVVEGEVVIERRTYPVVEGAVLIAGKTYSVVEDPVPAPSKELACIKIRSLFSRYLFEALAVDDVEELNKIISHIQAAFKLPWINTHLPHNNTSQNFSNAEVNAYVQLCLKAKKIEELYQLSLHGLTVGDEHIPAGKIQESIWFYLAEYTLTDVSEEIVRDLIVSIAPTYLNEEFTNIRENLYKIRLIYQFGSDEQKTKLNETFIFSLNTEQDKEKFREKFNLFLGIHTENIDQVFSGILWQSHKTYVRAQACWNVLCESLVHQEVKGLSPDKQHELVKIIAAHLLLEQEQEQIETRLAAICEAKALKAYLDDAQYWIQEPSDVQAGARMDFNLLIWRGKVDAVLQHARPVDKASLRSAFERRKESLLNSAFVQEAISKNRLELLINVGSRISSDSLAFLTVLENKIPEAKTSVFNHFKAFETQFSQAKPAYFYFTLTDLLEIANASKDNKKLILQRIEELRLSITNHSLIQIINLVEEVAKQEICTFLSSVTQEMVETLNEANHRLLTMEQEYSPVLLDAVTAFQTVLNKVIEGKKLDEARRKLEACLTREFNDSAKILLTQMYAELNSELEREPLNLERIQALKNKLPFDRTVKLQNIMTYMDLIYSQQDSSEMIHTPEGISEDQLYNKNDIISVLTLLEEDGPGLPPDVVKKAINYLIDYYVPGSYILMGSDKAGHPHNLPETEGRARLAQRLWLCDRIVRHYYDKHSANGTPYVLSQEKERIEKNRINVELYFLRHAIHHIKAAPPLRVDSCVLLLQAAYPDTEAHQGKYNGFFKFRLNYRQKAECRESYEALAAIYYCDLQAKLNDQTLDHFFSSLSQQIEEAFLEQNFLTAARLVKTFYLVENKLENPVIWSVERPHFEEVLLRCLNELAFPHDAKVQELLDSRVANIIARYAKKDELKTKANSLTAQCESSLEFSVAMTQELERVLEDNNAMQKPLFLPEGPLFISENKRNDWLAKIALLRPREYGEAYAKLQKALGYIITNVSDSQKLKEGVEKFNEESSWPVLKERKALLHCPAVISVTENKPFNRSLANWNVKEAEAMIKEHKKQRSVGGHSWSYRVADGLKRSEHSELITFEVYRELIQELKEYLAEMNIQRSSELDMALQQVCVADHVMTFEDAAKGCLNQAVSHLKEPAEAWIGKQIIVMLKKVALMLEKINAHPQQNFIAGLIELRQFLSFHYSTFRQAQAQYGLKGEKARRYEKMLKERSIFLAALTYPFAGPLQDTFDAVMSVYPQAIPQTSQLVRSGSSIKGSSSSLHRSETSSVATSELTFMNSGIERLTSEEDSFDVGFQMAKAWQSTVFLSDYPEVKLAWEQGFHHIWFELHMILTQANAAIENRSLDAPSPIRRAALLRLLGLCVAWEGELPGQHNLHQFMALFELACDHPDTGFSRDVMVLQDALEVYRQTSGANFSKQAKWFYVSMHLFLLGRKSVLDHDDYKLFIECCHYVNTAIQPLPIQKILDQMEVVGAKVPRALLWRQWPTWCENQDAPILLRMQRLLSPPESVQELNYLCSYLQDSRIPHDIKEWMQKEILSVKTKVFWKEFVLQREGALLPRLLRIAEDDRSELKDWAIECFSSIQEVTEEPIRAILRNELMSCLKKDAHPLVEKIKTLFFPPKSTEDLNFMYSCILQSDITDAVKIMMQRRMLSPSVKGKDFLDSFMLQANSPLLSLLTLAQSSEIEGQKEWAVEFLLSAETMREGEWLNVASQIADDENIILRLLKCKILLSNGRQVDDVLESLKAILKPVRILERWVGLNPTCQNLFFRTVDNIVKLIPSHDDLQAIELLVQGAYAALKPSQVNSHTGETSMVGNPYLVASVRPVSDSVSPFVSAR